MYRRPDTVRALALSSPSLPRPSCLAPRWTACPNQRAASTTPSTRRSPSLGATSWKDARPDYAHAASGRDRDGTTSTTTLPRVSVDKSQGTAAVDEAVRLVPTAPPTAADGAARHGGGRGGVGDAGGSSCSDGADGSGRRPRACAGTAHSLGRRGLRSTTAVERRALPAPTHCQCSFQRVCERRFTARVGLAASATAAGRPRPHLQRGCVHHRVTEAPVSAPPSGPPRVGGGRRRGGDQRQ